MERELKPISGIDELERMLAESRTCPLLLFKHSYTCGVSAEALDEVYAHIGEQARGVRYALVTVQTHRDVSKVLPSVSDLYYTMLQGGNPTIDPLYVGELNMHQWGVALDRMLQIRHETPQAILVRNGRAVWNASHFRVTASEVDRAIQATLA